jgi:hypothetical protein
MKTIGSILTMVAAVLMSNVVLASGLNVNLASNDANMAVMEISNNEMSMFEIEVDNAYGENLYRIKTEAPTNEFKKRYDFSELEDGTYWYSVKIDDEKVVKQLVIEDGIVNVVDVRKTLDPYFVQKDGMLKMSFLNFQQEEVKLYVYGPDSELVTEAKLGNDFTINRAIDISELQKGEYDVVIAHNDDVYEHTFSVE